MSDNLGVVDFAINLVYILFSTCLTGKWKFLVKLKLKKTELDYSVGYTAAAQKKKPSTPIRSGTYDLVVTSSDAVPLSYMRLVGTKVTKLGSCDKDIAYYLD